MRIGSGRRGSKYFQTKVIAGLGSAIVAIVAATLLFVSCSDKKDPIDPPVEVPNSPNLLSFISATQHSMTLNFNDRSENEDGFRLYRQIDAAWYQFLQINAHTGIGTVTVQPGSLQPATSYRWRVTAFNADGESDPSNEIQASTDGPNLPPAPDSIRAEPLATSVARVSWRSFGGATQFRVQRHGASDTWSDVATVGGGVTAHNDSNLTANTLYYYRVGAQNAEGTSWSVDSASVLTLPPGVPNAPDNLTADLDLGQRVILHWIDRSTDEDSFELQRSVTGQPFQPLATLEANTQSYADELGDTPNIYFYRIRAVNGSGTSAWVVLRVDFRYCSFGLIPLCLGNYWEYEVDSVSGADFVQARQVGDVEMIAGSDYYLLTQWLFPGGLRDSLYFLRNGGAFGTYYVDYPIPHNPTPQLLYRYPAGIGQYAIIDGDCVIVTTTSTDVTIGDTVYEDCVGYQWYRQGGRSTQLWIKPNTIGVVRERDYINNGADLIVTRELRYSSIEQE